MKISFLRLAPIFLLAIGFLILIGCKQEAQVANAPTPAAVKKVDKKANFTLGGIDEETFNSLLEHGDHIDLIFNNLPLSMNQDGNQSLYLDLQYLSSQPVTEIPANCKPMLRKIYLSKGEIIMEGDLYHGDGCFFQVFIKDGAELYGNHLTPQGIEYIFQLLKQAEQVKPTQ